MAYLDVGQWTAATLGQFVATVVDGGDPAVIYRIIHDTEPNNHGKFVRELQVLIVPDGQVYHMIKQVGGDVIVHKVLAKFLQEGVLS